MWFGVGVDVGTTNTKVVGLDVDGDRPPRVRFTLQTTTPTDALALDRAVHRLLIDAAHRLPGPAGAIGIASMAETGVPLGRDDLPLIPFIRWQDADRAEDAAALASMASPDDLFAATGVRIGPKPPLVMWHWLRRTRPDVFRRLHRWAGVADWLHHRLTGRLVTDHTLAGRTGGYRLVDPRSGPFGGLPAGFDPDLLALAGLRVDQLPSVRRPGEPVDGLTDPDLVAAGFPAGTPVLVCGHDHQVAAWAAGVRRPGQTADSVGTAEAVLTVLSDRPTVEGPTVDGPDPLRPAAVAASGMSLVRTVGGGTAVLGGASAAGGFLQWYADAHGSGDVALDFTDVEVWPTASIVLPYPTGRQCPVPDPDARPVIIGTPDAAAALHGVAYQAAWMARTQASLVATAPGELVVIGEPIRRNQTWATVKAALAPGATHIVVEEQPVAAGAALLAGVAAGSVSPSLTLRTTPGVDVDDRTRQAHADGLRRFVDAATAGSATRSAITNDHDVTHDTDNEEHLR